MARERKAKASELVVEERRKRVDEVVARRTRSLTLVLEEVEDPHNLAAVVRTCEAFGLQEIHVVESEKARFRPNPKITQGSEKWVEIVTHKSVFAAVAHLRQRGFKVYATRPGPSATSLYDLPFQGKVALLFGNEVEGVTPRAIAAADGTFWIPLRGMTRSLNISVAAAVSLGHGIFARRARRGELGDLDPSEAEELRERFYQLSVKQRGRIFGAENL